MARARRRREPEWNHPRVDPSICMAIAHEAAALERAFQPLKPMKKSWSEKLNVSLSRIEQLLSEGRRLLGI